MNRLQNEIELTNRTPVTIYTSQTAVKENAPPGVCVVLLSPGEEPPTDYEADDYYRR